MLYLHQEHGFSDAGAGVVVAAVQVIGGAMRILIGRWSDVLGSRMRPLRQMTIVVSACVAGVALLDSAPRPFLVLAVVAAGAFAQGWSGLAFTAAAELAGGARSGTALGLQQTGLSVWGAAVPPAFAVLVEATSWSVGFAAVAGATLSAYPFLRGIGD